MINYGYLTASLKFYESVGFSRIEVPWWVSKEIGDVTFNAGNKFELNGGKILVGSGEQGFLHLISKGNLPDGQFVTLTPCFREDFNGIYYQKNFMKTELIKTNSVCNEELKKMIDLCLNFFKSITEPKHHELLTVVETSIGYDINFNGIEIGSYGIRTCSFIKWIYATGLAEPRFSKIQKSLNNNRTE